MNVNALLRRALKRLPDKDRKDHPEIKRVRADLSSALKGKDLCEKRAALESAIDDGLIPRDLVLKAKKMLRTLPRRFSASPRFMVTVELEDIEAVSQAEAETIMIGIVQSVRVDGHIRVKRGGKWTKVHVCADAEIEDYNDVESEIANSIEESD